MYKIKGSDNTYILKLNKLSTVLQPIIILRAISYGRSRMQGSKGKDVKQSPEEIRQRFFKVLSLPMESDRTH